jgi:branched-subunit amino acid transport protein
MSDGKIWLVVVGLTLVSILTRSFFLLLGNKISLSDRVQRALRYAPVGALTAIVAPEILVTTGGDGGCAFSITHPQLWGGIAATAGMLWSRSMLVTILVGMAVYSVTRTLW